MTAYFTLIFGFMGALWLFNDRRQKRLDADPAQHHLASLLVGAVDGQPGASQRIAAEQLDQIAKGSADRRVRLTHAVMLVRGSAGAELYAKVLELSRRL